MDKREHRAGKGTTRHETNQQTLVTKSGVKLASQISGSCDPEDRIIGESMSPEKHSTTCEETERALGCESNRYSTVTGGGEG